MKMCVRPAFDRLSWWASATQQILRAARLQLGAQGDRGVGNIYRSSGTRRHTGAELESLYRRASRAEAWAFTYGARTENLGGNLMKNFFGISRAAEAGHPTRILSRLWRQPRRIGFLRYT
mmetsp:Transcript_26756/g.27115  ORF Transcript_26756/g.27115 Transcript_26756/m.27115 type:complete len:120 (-) Transcript_26756:978-1337(-)